MRLIDSHCHLDFPDFADELDAVVARARAAGVETMITIGTRLDKAQRLAEIAEAYDDVYFTVGAHPHEAATRGGERLRDPAPARRASEMRRRSARPGSTTTTTTRRPRSPRRSFAARSRSRASSDLPLVVHTREAEADTAAILKEEMGRGPSRACCTASPRRGRSPRPRSTSAS